MKFRLYWILCIFIGLIGATTGCKYTYPEGAPALINAFSNSCISTGKWTQAALNQSKALVTVLQSIQDLDPCRPYLAQLAQMTNASSQMQAILSDPLYSEFQAAEQTVHELMLELGNQQPGSDLAKQLTTQLVSSQVDLVRKRSEYIAGSEFTRRDRLIRAGNQFSNYSQTLLTNVREIQSCLQQSPAAAIAVASNLLTLGGGIASPSFGAAGAVVSQMINLAILTVRNAASNRAIWNLYAAQMPVALSCALESMTELYCNATDAASLLKVQASSYQTPRDFPEPLWRSLDLQERRMPVLVNWLRSVRNGILPADPQEAQRQNQAWARLHSLDIYYRSATGDINRQILLLDGVPDDQQAKDNIIATSIFTLSQMMSGMNANPSMTLGLPNPFSSLNANGDQLSCWLAAGYLQNGQIVSCDPPDLMKGITGQMYIKTVLLPKYAPKLADVRRNFDVIYDSLSKQISLEFAQTITADPKPILASALAPVTGNLSPREVLNKILEFLQERKNRGSDANPQMGPLLDDTIGMVQKGIHIIEDTSDTPPEQKIRALFEVFQLARGWQIFTQRISNFVQWDLLERLENGEFPVDVSRILAIAGGDIRNRLTESGVTNLDSMMMDLNASRALTTSNISIFRDFFGSALAKAVTSLHAQDQDAGEDLTGADRPIGQTLAHLCTMILTTGRHWLKEASWEICSKTHLNSVYPDPSGSLNLNLEEMKQELEGKSDRVRFCRFHRYLRAGRIAEVIDQKKNRSFWHQTPNDLSGYRTPPTERED